VGPHPGPLGMVSRWLRRAAGLGAGACRLDRRARLAGREQPRLAGLRLGPAGMGRGLPSALEGLLGRLLGALQQALRREHVDSPQCAPDAFCQFDRARRRYRGSGCGIRGTQASSVQYRRDSSQRHRERTGTRCADNPTGDPPNARDQAWKRNAVACVDDVYGDASAAQDRRAHGCGSEPRSHGARADCFPRSSGCLHASQFRARRVAAGCQACTGFHVTNSEH